MPAGSFLLRIASSSQRPRLDSALIPLIRMTTTLMLIWGSSKTTKLRKALQVQNMTRGISTMTLLYSNSRGRSNFHDGFRLYVIPCVKIGKYTNSLFQPICLKSPTDDLTESDLLVSAGWGHTQYGGRPSDKLLKTRGLRRVPTSKCESTFREYLGKTFPVKSYDDDLVCAQDKTFQSDPCQVIINI